MKHFKTSIEHAGISEGLYNCTASWWSVGWIEKTDNYDMTEEELINWADSNEPYILEVYDNSVYTKHGQGD